MAASTADATALAGMGRTPLGMIQPSGASPTPTRWPTGDNRRANIHVAQRGDAG